MPDRNVKLLSLVSFLNDMSSEMMFPLLPFFLTSIGASSLAIGLAGGIVEGISGIMKVVSGYISDVKGKKKLVFAGYSLSQLSKFGICLSSTPFSALFFMLLERCGKGIRTAPRDALIAESSRKNEKGRAFGFHRAMDSLGAVVGASLALFLFIHWDNVRKVLLAAAIVGFLSLFPILLVRETGVKVKKPKLGLRMRRFALLSLIFGAANLSYMFFLVNFRGIVASLSAYVLFTAIYALLSYPAGMVSDIVGKRVVASLGYSVMALACLSALVYPALSLVLLGVFMAMTDAVQRSFVAEIAENYGFGMGAFQLCFGISALIFNAIYGLLWSASRELVFFTAATFAILSSFVFMKV